MGKRQCQKVLRFELFDMGLVGLETEIFTHKGVKTGGILLQMLMMLSTEFERKTEFSPEEDPHIVVDCVKHVLRELPSSPVSASCCNALLEACRTDRGGRVTAMRVAICETFPEPNRLLLQRILTMMQ